MFECISMQAFEGRKCKSTGSSTRKMHVPMIFIEFYYNDIPALKNLKEIYVAQSVERTWRDKHHQLNLGLFTKLGLRVR